MRGWWRWGLVSPDGVAPIWMVDVSASVYLPLPHEVQKLSSDTGSPGWSQKMAVKWLWCGCGITPHLLSDSMLLIHGRTVKSATSSIPGCVTNATVRRHRSSLVKGVDSAFLDT